MDKLLDFLQNEYAKRLDGRLRFLLTDYPVEDIVRYITGWLQTGEADYFDTTTFARDFYIGSDLAEVEKDLFYHELKKQGFFQHLTRRLYSDNLPIASWTIYTFGKFSEPEQATFLETAYETRYAFSNPILSYRCLNELDWLESGKVNHYLEDLKNEQSLIARLVLLYFWIPKSYHPEFKTMLQDKELINFIIPQQGTDPIEESIAERLLNFENYITELYNDKGSIFMEKHDFETMAKEYFINYR